MFIIILACAMTLSMMIATMIMLHSEAVHVRSEEQATVATHVCAP